jgi:hypothetical protein
MIWENEASGRIEVPALGPTKPYPSQPKTVPPHQWQMLLILTLNTPFQFLIHCPTSSQLITLIFPVCEYYVHTECQDFAVAECKENATYLPDKELSSVHHQHHWREGNLPSNSKCVVCKKTCWSAECLAGFRCEWCGITVSIIIACICILYMSHFHTRICCSCVHEQIIYIGFTEEKKILP